MTETVVPLKDTLADNELLLPDSRVEELWHALRKAYPKLPDDFQVATYIQPARLVPSQSGRGDLRHITERAVFLIVSKNPHPRHENEMLKTIASIPYTAWREEEANAWRFVNGGADPALKFLRAAARDHIRTWTNYKEMN